MILVFGSRRDEALLTLADELEARGNELIFLELEAWPGSLGLHLPPPGQPVQFLWEDQVISASGCRSLALNRFYVDASQAQDYSESDWSYLESEGWAALQAAFYRLNREIRVANFFFSQDLFQSRASELLYLSGLGLPTPRCLLSSHPQTVREFAKKVGGPLQFRTISDLDGASRTLSEGEWSLLDERLHRCPAHFEETLPGELVRSVMVDEQWHTWPARELPRKLIGLMQAVARKLGLRWVEWFLRQRSGGDWVVVRMAPFPTAAAFEREEVLESCCRWLEVEG